MSSFKLSTRVSAPRVVVIGVGLAGSACADELVKMHKATPIEIVLIDVRSASILKYAGTRSAAMGNSFAYRACIPNCNLVPPDKGRVVNKLVKLIDEERKIVICEDGEQISYQFLVCASGAQNVSPCEPPLTLRHAKEQIAFYEEVATHIRAAKHVTVLGSGAVGTELAGEIKHAHPNKGVAILSPGETLVDNCVAQPPKKFYSQIESVATKIGIQVFLKQRPTNITLADFEGKSYLLGSRELITDSGQQINTDLVLICTGKRLNNSFYPKSWLGRHDSVKVESTLQVVGKKEVFAIGDINDVVETKQGYFAQKQGRLAARNIQRILKRKTQLAAYSPSESAMILVPLGRSHGVGTIFGVVAGAVLVTNTKGRDLFVNMHWKLYRMKSLLIKENDPNWLLWLESSYPKPEIVEIIDEDDYSVMNKLSPPQSVRMGDVETQSVAGSRRRGRVRQENSFDTTGADLTSMTSAMRLKLPGSEEMISLTPSVVSRRRKKKRSTNNSFVNEIA